MSEIKHTPGPWTLNRHGAIVGGEFHQYTNGKAQSQVAMAVGGNGISEEMLKANARLIAAAPELLEALKGVLPYMEAAEEAGLVGDEGCHWPVEAVRAAIAKATGEQA